MGKSSAVGGILEEFQTAADKIAEAEGKPVHVYNVMLPCASNNISTLLYGQRFPWDHPIRAHVDKLIKSLVTALHTAGLYQFNPTFFTMILKKLPGSRLNKLVTRIDDITTFTKKQIEEHTATSEKGFDRDFIDIYLGKMEDTQTSPNPYFNMNNLVGIVTGFFAAGTLSTASTILWHLVKFAQEPDTLQSKVQQEIDQVVGRQRKPTWEDRLRMPFTMACVWEMDRWKTAVPLSPPREASQDVVVDGLYIPKGTVIMANFWAVHFDPNLWKNPLKFDPSRFLNEDGSLMARKPDYLMAFSSGKRSCPGEILATMEVFLAVTSFLQRFRVIPEGEIPFDLDDPKILTRHVACLKLKFLPRPLAD
ncbi:cytochrome P450 2C3-like [Haemaphysalis longicornis]